jgi:hypothetical protein
VSGPEGREAQRMLIFEMMCLDIEQPCLLFQEYGRVRRNLGILP